MKRPQPSKSLALCIVLLVVHFLSSAQASAPADTYIRSQRLGITFIGSPEHPADDARYQRALELGAGWNRWPLYWNHVETQPGVFDWTAADRAVRDDIAHGLRTDAILLGMPEFRRDEGRIAGLNAPIYSDGTDTYREDKTLNPENYWADFVRRALERYRPGGALAQEMGWTAGEGIRVWEIWNEPDFALFWSGSISDYARLLKVAYIVAHSIDPQAQIMFGGLIFNSEDGTNYLARVLAVLENDPLRAENNWYMDIVAVHNYNYAWRSGWLVRWVRETLEAYGLTRPIWLNETGAPVWDDYPGPTWAQTPEERVLRVTQQQQAWFLVQSAAYAWSEGADVIFYHQLYDDCGNQAPGTDFAPYDGENAGDAFGLFRNEAHALCFSQHPQPGSARPAAHAFRLLAQVFANLPFRSVAMLDMPDGSTGVLFDLGTRTVRVLWNQTLTDIKVMLPAQTAQAVLLVSDGRFVLGAARQETRLVYEVNLPAAVVDDFPFLNIGDVVGIGGAPSILIEGTPP
ncbi:MAG: hypothetical protein HXY40_10175 [Chloroflexi bacterium]|nr:hypothetical protein [Chloroflexota bacterium]